MELKRHLGICHPSDESRLILRYQPLANYAITVNRFECYICKIQMKKIADVKDHIKQHSYGQTCKICNKYFMTIEEHQLHMCGAKKRSIICEYCDGSFSAISQLLSHLECEHDNRIMYKCRKCSKFFGMKRLRCLHENSPYHTVETEKLFACNQCSKRFWTRHNLKNHLQIHATESKQHEKQPLNFEFDKVKTKIFTFHFNHITMQGISCANSAARDLKLRSHYAFIQLYMQSNHFNVPIARRNVKVNCD